MKRSLGHGIGLRRAHFGHLLSATDFEVDWFEIISENFFEPGGRPWAVLDRVRAAKPVVMHGTAMGIGNAAGVSAAYLSQLRRLIERVEPAWVSDHLCWGGSQGHYAHDLLPLPYTEEAMFRVVEEVDRVQETIGRAILLENVSSYVGFVSSAMSEWEFLSEVAVRSGSGILLDVNNIYVSAKNHGFSAEEYLSKVPVEHVKQLHLAGHTNKGTFLLDTHLGPVPACVWELYKKTLLRFGQVPTLIEWDEAVPEYCVVVAESKKARAIEAEVLGDA